MSATSPDHQCAISSIYCFRQDQGCPLACQSSSSWNTFQRKQAALRTSCVGISSQPNQTPSSWAFSPGRPKKTRPFPGSKRLSLGRSAARMESTPLLPGGGAFPTGGTFGAEGLSSAEAKNRRAEDGPNVLDPPPKERSDGRALPLFNYLLLHFAKGC